MTDGCLRSDGKGCGGQIHPQRLPLQFTANDYTDGGILIHSQFVLSDGHFDA